jgi:hypothetical protein
MAISKKNPLTKGVSGMVGKTFYFREVFGQQQIVNRPKKPTSFSESQLFNQGRMQRASAYARKQMKNPEIEKEYAKVVDASRRSSYHAALVDWLNPPTVHYIKTTLYKGAIGNTITIKATDDFKVVRVAVEIFNAKGKLLEEGDAARYIYKPFIWKYKASVINSKLKGTVIKVIAFDRPGNMAISEVKL